MDFLFLLVFFIFFIQQFVNVEAQGQVRSSISILNPVFNDRKIQEIAMISSLVRNKIQCTSLCQETTNCQSLSYRKQTQMCVLFDKDFTDVNSTANEVEAGWQYLYVIQGSDQRGKGCIEQSVTGICSLYCLSYTNQPLAVTHADLSGTCESYSGGELVKIDRGLKQYCVEQLLENKSNGDVLIQGRKNESQNVWKFNDGTEIKCLNWDITSNTPQPNNRPYEIDLGLVKNKGYGWHDLRDGTFTAAVCQQT